MLSCRFVVFCGGDEFFHLNHLQGKLFRALTDSQKCKWVLR